jgi:hypothetical protein
VNSQGEKTASPSELLFGCSTEVRLKKISKFFYSPSDAQVNCLKNNFKFYIKIDIKTAPTCFGAVTPSSGSALLVLAKVTVAKIIN